MSLPRFVTEWEPDRPLDDCGLAAGAMATDAATGGRCHPTRLHMRQACGIPDRDGISDPTFPVNVARAITSLCDGVEVEYSGTGGTLRLPWDGFMARLRAGSAAVLNGMHKDLPAHRCDDPGYMGGHSIAVVWYRGGLTMFEPLVNAKPSGYTGERISEAALRSFARGYMSSAGHVAGVLVTEVDGVIGPFTPDVALCDLTGGTRMLAENRRDSWTIGKAGGHGVLQLGKTDDSYRVVVVKRNGQVVQALTKGGVNVRPLASDADELQARIDAAMAALKGKQT
jgi:hypothetical protein